MSLICYHIRQQVCNVRCTDLHVAEEETILKRIYGGLVKPSVDGMPELYSGAATATASTFNRDELLYIARWDSVS